MLDGVIAVLAPGQGAQTPGMLAPWLELPEAAQTVERYGELTGLDMIRLGTTAGAEEIKDTAVTQPLVVALGLLAAQLLDLVSDDNTLVTAGHSVGELTATAVAGALEADEAIALAARRGAEMAAACALAATGMSAVLGGDQDEVVAAIAALGLTAANRNGAGQIVAAGALDALAKLGDEPPAGARVRPLPVAGAFHTHYMAPAEEALARYATTLTARDPAQLLVSNADGTAIADGSSVLLRLVRQVTRPVRWDLCQHTLRDIGVTAAIELPPAGTLAGLAKRELPGVDVVTIKTPDDLAKARALIGSRPQHGQGEHTPEFRVAVTPVKGVFTREDGLDEGNELRAGTRIGTVRTNRDEHPVVVPSAGFLVEWLRHDGDIVGAGLPVARLHGSEH